MAKGLILGRLPNASTPSRFKAAAALFNPRVGSKDACQRFLRAMRGRKAKGPLVTLPNAVHTAIFAPTGVGKGVSCVIPFLLTCDESCVVVDFKGELAQITAKARQKMGHRVVLLDPFNAVTKTPDSFNPLDFIDGNS